MECFLFDFLSLCFNLFQSRYFWFSQSFLSMLTSACLFSIWLLCTVFKISGDVVTQFWQLLDLNRKQSWITFCIFKNSKNVSVLFHVECFILSLLSGNNLRKWTSRWAYFIYLYTGDSAFSVLLWIILNILLTAIYYLKAILLLLILKILFVVWIYLIGPII